MDLIGAVIENDKLAVLNLLVAGSDIHESDDDAGITALHHAVVYADLEVIFLLISYGADPFIKSNECGQSPVDIALALGKSRVVSLFLNANLNRQLH